jgi:hypothetical protein
MVSFASRQDSTRKITLSRRLTRAVVTSQSRPWIRLSSGRIPALIKLDVEGYEAEVLRGALALLAAPGLKAILTENRSPPVVDALRNAGLTEVAYDAFGHQLVPAKEVPMANALFLRDLDHVATRVAQTPPVRILGTMV